MTRILKFAFMAVFTAMTIQFSIAGDLTVGEIANKMSKAPDPNGLYKECKSFFLKQKLVNDKSEIIVEVTFKVPDMSKSVTLVDGKAVNKVFFKRGNAWSVDSNGNKKEIKGVELESMKIMNNLQNPNSTISNVFKKIDLREGKSGETDCYLLKCCYGENDKDEMTFYVDKKDFLTRKIAMVKDKKPYLAETKKYSLLQGVLVGSETMIEFQGNKQTLIVVDYKLNVEVADSEFEP